jgi:hypothetical protein
MDDYSHMVMENKYMDDGGGGCDEKALENPLSRVEMRILQPQKQRSRWWRCSRPHKIPPSW